MMPDNQRGEVYDGGLALKAGPKGGNSNKKNSKSKKISRSIKRKSTLAQAGSDVFV